MKQLPTMDIGDRIVFGGTGSGNLNSVLPDEVENLDPDYSVYPQNNESFGFITRGCIRKCPFCVVPEKEGLIRQVSTISAIVKHKKVNFLDNNILAFNNHLDVLKELVEKRTYCRFMQGLDIRLVTKENGELLSKLRYLKEYTFAFDDIKYFECIKEKLKFLNWRHEWQLRFFVYCHPDMKISTVLFRINWLKKQKILPYLMRDISCWKSDNSNFYVDLAGYTNQPGIFKLYEFEEYLYERTTDLARIKKSLELYKTN